MFFSDRQQFAMHLERNFNFKESQKCTDVTFVVDGVAFPAHKVIVASQSDVFTAMFSSNFVEAASNDVHIADVSSDAFKDFLDFLYLGSLTEKGKKNAVELMLLADKYNVQSLLGFCDDYFISSSDSSNVMERLRIACLLNRKALKAALNSFMKNWLKTSSDALDGWSCLANDFQLITELAASFPPLRVELAWNLRSGALNVYETVSMTVDGQEVDLSVEIVASGDCLKGYISLNNLARRVAVVFQYSFNETVNGWGEVFWEEKDYDLPYFNRHLFEIPNDCQEMNAAVSMRMVLSGTKLADESRKGSPVRGVNRARFGDWEESNVIVLVGCTYFPLLRSVLAEESGLFRSLFKAPAIRHRIGDIDSSTFQKLCIAMYSGSLPHSVDWDFVRGAVRLQLSWWIVYRCQLKLVDEINENNAWEFLKEAEPLGLNLVASAALAAIVGHCNKHKKHDANDRYPELLSRSVHTMLPEEMNLILDQLGEERCPARLNSQSYNALRRYVLSGSLPLKDDINLNLLAVAAEYRVGFLRIYCERHIRRTLSSNNVVQTLVEASQLQGTENVRKAAVDYIAARHLEIIRSPSWNELQSHGNLTRLIILRLAS